MKKKLPILYYLLLSLSTSSLSAYDNIVTHQDLTISAVESSILKTENYLSINFGTFFHTGIETTVSKKNVDTWIRNGANFEDGEPNENSCRASNHFHNPIKGWQNGSVIGWEHAQMTDGALSWLGRRINRHCGNFGWSPETRKSNITWATEYLEPVADDAQKIMVSKQFWSWTYARNHFYAALTSMEPEARDLAFSNAFRAIGQIIHLIQDSAQPAHVRNDFQSHLELTHIGIESPVSWVGSPYERYVKMHTELVTTAIPIRPDIEDPSLTDFWDTNSYDGSVQLNGLNLGLTEYTNANYFSEETIPNNVNSIWQFNSAAKKREHLFPYPVLNTNDYASCSVEDYGGSLKIHIARKSRGGCESGDHIAQLSLTNAPKNTDIPGPPNFDISTARMTLDHDVYKTYAKELLPLAIGYSSALIDYFFRGKLGVIKKQNGLVIKNNSDEEMSAFQDENNLIGKIEILYDRPDGSRHSLVEYTLNQPLAAGEETPLIPFSAPADNITADRYIVVFRGKLGKEEGAVIAKVVSPKIYYVAQHNIDDQTIRKIMRMEADGQFKTVVFNNTDANFKIGRIAISPDASALAFSGSHSDDPAFIYTLDISIGWKENPKQLTEGYWPDWSPDGNQLIFQKGVDSADGSTRGQVFSYDLKTDMEALLAGGVDRTDAQPSWSPDQNKIAYITNASGEAPKTGPGPGEIACGNLGRSIELMDAGGTHTGSGTDCLSNFYIITDTGAQNGYPNRVGSIQQPVWNPNGNEIMYLGTFGFLNTNYTEIGGDSLYLDYTFQPFKININTQQETALFDIDDEINIHFTGASSWSLDGKTIAVTRLGQSASGALSLSKSHLVLIDANTGEELEDLTTLDPHGSFYPDFGY